MVAKFKSYCIIEAVSKSLLCPQEGKKPSECLKEGHCKGLQVAFFECKRSMVSTSAAEIFLRSFLF